MRSRLPLIAWALVWVVLVVLSAASVWWAISRAGSHVTSMAAPQLPADSGSASPTSTPSDTPVPTRSVPVATASAAPSRTPAPHASTAAAPVSHTPTVAAVRRSWSGAAGRVTATCRTTRISLDAAVPADGYSVEIGERGPETLEVEFHESEGHQEAKVRSACRDGEPQFTVEQE